MSLENAILFYDDRCGLCTGAVRWIKRLDRKRKIMLHALSSPEGIQAIRMVQIENADYFDSIILRSDERYLIKSEAVIEVFSVLGGYWKFVAVIIGSVSPKLRNKMYEWIAANRHRWFGNSSLACSYKPTVEKIK